MPSGIEILPFRGGPNQDIMNAIRYESTPVYQERIPEATQASMLEVANEIMSYQPARNEFLNNLINRIGMTIARNAVWSNPLAKFKRGMLEMGDTIEEIQMGLATGYGYDPSRDYGQAEIWGQSSVESKSAWHKIDRQQYYPITVNQAMLRRAFLNPNGLQQLIAQILAVPTTSDQWDEFLLTCQLFKQYEDNGGFFKVNVPNVAAITSTQDDAKGTLRSIRTVTELLLFISRDYNAARMPVFAQRDELELFLTPEANAAIDVEALAAAFNLGKADIPSRTTIIPQEQFNIPNAQALLTTKDFFVIADTLIENRVAQNPVGLYDNYFFHHHEVISASPFVPAVLFTTDPGTVITINDNPIQSISAITFEDRNGNVLTTLPRGDFYQVIAQALQSEATRTVTDGDTTAGSTTVTSATANFVAGDVGAVITGGSIPANTTIVSVTDSATAVLSAAPTATATGVSFTIVETLVAGTNNQVALTMFGALSQMSFLSQTGTLYVAPDENSAALTITATSVDNPLVSRKVVVDLSGDIIQFWPNPTVNPSTSAETITETP